MRREDVADSKELLDAGSEAGATDDDIVLVGSVHELPEGLGGACVDCLRRAKRAEERTEQRSDELEYYSSAEVPETDFDIS